MDKNRWIENWMNFYGKDSWIENFSTSMAISSIATTTPQTTIIKHHIVYTSFFILFILFVCLLVFLLLWNRTQWQIQSTKCWLSIPFFISTMMMIVGLSTVNNGNSINQKGIGLSTIVFRFMVYSVHVAWRPDQRRKII